MKAKTLSLMSLSIFAIILLVSFASAAIEFVPTSITQSSSGNGDVVVSFQLTNTNATDYTSLAWSGTPSTGSLTLPALTILNGNSNSSSLSATFSGIPVGFNGSISANIVVADGANGDTLPVSLTILPTFESTLCNDADLGNLKLSIDDFTNKGVPNSADLGDDTEWFPLEEIEVDIDVDNQGNDDIKDIVIEWGLYNSDTDEWIVDDEENDFNLKDGDDDTLTITFELDDVNDFEDGNDYRFYVWATGEDDDFDGNDTCVSDSEEIDIIIENDFVALSDFDFPEVLSCGENFQLNADIWNIGDDDQEDVLVRIVSSELGINEKVTIGDVDAFDSEKLDISLDIPQDADEKFYTLLFEVYDEDNDLFETDFDDDESRYNIQLRVEGGCGLALSSASVSASLESGGEAGKELVIKSTITNNEDKSVIYKVSAEGYSQWASSVDVSSRSFALAAGESKDVLFTFDVADDASGEEFFDIEVMADGMVVKSQPVSVSVEGKQGFLSGITGGAIGANTNVLWGIGIINVILVIIIIIVAVRIMRSR